MSPSTARPTDQRRSRPLTAPALAAAVLGFFVVTLDAVIVNVVLPSVGTDLGGGVAGLQGWSTATPSCSPRCCSRPGHSETGSALDARSGSG